MSAPNHTTEPFAMYVRAATGRVVPRFGHIGRYIGGLRRPDRGWDFSDRVEALSHAEAGRFKVEYQRALKRGDLVKCTREDYLADNEKRVAARAALLGESAVTTPAEPLQES